ncbi:MAG: hypothetical protein ACPHK8_05130 [Thermoplasmatota archaeon]
MAEEAVAEILRNEGHYVHMVPYDYNQYGSIVQRDVFGIADLVSVNGDVWFHQVTDGGGIGARQKRFAKNLPAGAYGRLLWVRSEEGFHVQDQDTGEWYECLLPETLSST